MSKTTWTARTKSQLAAALARKGFDRASIRQTCDNAVRFGAWDDHNFTVANEHHAAAVVITYGDTEVDLWDAQLMTETEHEAWANAQHAARKANARKWAKTWDHAPVAGETFDSYGEDVEVVAVFGPNAHDFGEDYYVIDYKTPFGTTHALSVIVDDTTPCDPDTGVQHGPQFAADPANPTDDELAGAIARDLAAGRLIDAAEWMAANADLADDTDPDEEDLTDAGDTYEDEATGEIIETNIRAAAGLDPERSMIVSKGEVIVGTPAGHYHDPLGKYDYCDDPKCPRSQAGPVCAPEPIPGTTDTYSPADATKILAAFLGYCTPDHPFAVQHAQELLTIARRVGIAREVNGTSDTRVTVRPTGLGFFVLSYTRLR